MLVSVVVCGSLLLLLVVRVVLFGAVVVRCSCSLFVVVRLSPSLLLFAVVRCSL